MTGYLRAAGALGLAAVLLAGCATPESTEKPDLLQQQMRDAVEAYRERLPLELTEGARLLELETYEHVLDFTFQLDDVKKTANGDVDPMLGVIMSVIIKSMGCSNPKIKEMLNRDATIRFRFVDGSRQLANELDLDKEACTG